MRKKNSIYRYIEDHAKIVMLALLGARPNSICMLLPGAEWSDIKVSKVLKDQFGHGAKHGRRAVVAASGASREEVVQRTISYLFMEALGPWTEDDAQAVIESYEAYHFFATSVGAEPYPIERFIPFAQGAEKQGLRFVSCKSCSDPRLVEAYRIESLYVCETCAKVKKGSEVNPSAEVPAAAVGPDAAGATVPAELASNSST